MSVENTEPEVSEGQEPEKPEIIAETVVTEVKTESEHLESKISRSFTNNFVNSETKKPEHTATEAQSTEKSETSESSQNFTIFSDQDAKQPENCDVITQSSEVSRKFTNKLSGNFAQKATRDVIESTTREVSDVTSYVTCDDVSAIKSDVTNLNYSSSTETIVSSSKCENLLQNRESTEVESPTSESSEVQNSNSDSFKTAYTSC